jgi:hypothetical protein
MSMSLTHTELEVDPVYRKFHRMVIAFCIVLAPLAASLWFALCPTGANDAACPDQGSSLAVFAAFRAMNPQLMQVFLVINIVAGYVFPVSCIGLGLLAMKRSPWFATLGIACGWVGSMVWALIAGQVATIGGMAQIGSIPVFVTIEHNFYANWMILVFGTCWVIGHLAAYVLLGFALVRAQVIPRWAGWIFIVTPVLFGPIAYGTNFGLLQILGYVLILIASVPAALVTLKAKDK